MTQEATNGDDAHTNTHTQLPYSSLFLTCASIYLFHLTQMGEQPLDHALQSINRLGYGTSFRRLKLISSGSGPAVSFFIFILLCNVICALRIYCSFLVFRETSVVVCTKNCLSMALRTSSRRMTGALMMTTAFHSFTFKGTMENKPWRKGT